MSFDVVIAVSGQLGNDSLNRDEVCVRWPQAFRAICSSQEQLIEKVIKIRRCAAVVKGGRRFSFNGMVVVGNGRGKVGCGYGKANEVPPAVEKAVKDGARNMIDRPLEGSTIAHPVKGHFGASDVVLLPASPGTGVIAGAAVRAVAKRWNPRRLDQELTDRPIPSMS